MTVSMPIGKLLRREGLHIDYLPGREKVSFSNPAGIAVKQYSNDPDVAILDREGPDVDHGFVRKTLVANGFKVWVDDDRVLMAATNVPSRINVNAWKWAEET